MLYLLFPLPHQTRSPDIYSKGGHSSLKTLPVDRKQKHGGVVWPVEEKSGIYHVLLLITISYCLIMFMYFCLVHSLYYMSVPTITCGSKK